MAICDETKPYIFISYSHRDTVQVVSIIENLKKNGYNVWYDEGIDPGTEWDENIAHHVQNCGYFVAFISENYINSKNCKDELNYSRDLDKEQLLVYLEDVKLPGGMAMRMNRIQAIFWNKYKNQNDAYEKLFSAVGIEKTKIYDVEAQNSDANAMNSNSFDSSDRIAGNTVSVQGSVASGSTASVQGNATSGSTVSEQGSVASKNAASVQEGATAGSVLSATNTLNTTDKSGVSGVEESGSKTEKKSKKKLIIGIAAVVAVAAIALVIVLNMGGTHRDIKKGLNLLHATEYEEYDPVKALELFEKRAKEGDEDGKFLAGYTLASHLGGTKYEDNVKAMKYFESCEEDNYFAKACIGSLYGGKSGIEKDEKKQAELYELVKKNVDESSIDDSNIPYKGEAYSAIGTVYSNSKAGDADYITANKYFEFGEQYDCFAATINIGNTYYGGYGVTKSYTKAYEIWKTVADKGSSTAQYDIGYIYEYGNGDEFEKNVEEALKWYRMASDAGNYRAMRQIALIYYKAKITDEPDYAKAKEWFEKAAAAGDSEAMNYLGDMYYNGYGVDQDYAKAKEWYEKAIEKGNGNAYLLMGQIYFNGYGVDADTDKANEYYEKAYENGSEKAAYSIGVQYLDGNGREKNHEEAMKYLKEAAENGNVNAKFELGKQYASGNDFITANKQEAIHWYEEAANDGSNAAMYNLAIIYVDPGEDSGIEPDYEKALGLLKESYDNGYYYSSYLLAIAYYNGEGVPKDVEKAKQYLKVALKHIDEYNDAQKKGISNLKESLENDVLTIDNCLDKAKEAGDKKDYDNYFKYLQLGADKENNPSELKKANKDTLGRAHYLLAYCYLNGTGVSQNYTEAERIAQEGVDLNVVYSCLCYDALGEVYSRGNSFSRDVNVAKQYYELAIANMPEGWESTKKHVEEKIAALK